MIPYILLFCFALMMAPKIKQKKYSIFDFLYIIILTLFSGLRFNVGTDYNLYESIYKSTSGSVSNIANIATSRTGTGFSYICNIANNVFHIDYSVFLIICAFITVFLIYRFYKKYAKDPGIALLFYIALGFYASSFNGFRQWMAIALVLEAFSRLKDRKIIASVIFAFMSVMIHSSMIIPIVVYAVLELLRKKRVKALPVYGIAVIVLLSFSTFLTTILSGQEGYKMYLNYSAESGLGSLLMVAVYLCLMMLILRKRDKIEAIDENYRQFINVAIIGTGIMFLQIKNWLFERVAIDFTILLPIVLSGLYMIIVDKKSRAEKALIMIMLLIYLLVYVNSFSNLVPYRSILWL